ncbi:ABC transporter permease [Parapedobacter luteus]|nr:ABC transporter permease [Parapedobacter luteus]
MIKSYFKIAWRNILKTKNYTLINITGLAIGMAAAALILLWVENEWTFDRFYKNTDRIYELYNRGEFSNDTHAWPGVGNPLAPLLVSRHPELESVVRSTPANLSVSVQDNRFNSEGLYADPDFFNLFDRRVIRGDLHKALSTPEGIVLTASMANRLFGTDDVVGQTVTIDSADHFSVTALVEDFPANSRFKNAGYFLPWEYFEHSIGQKAAASWTNFKVATFVMLDPTANHQHVESQISAILTELQVADNMLFLHPAEKWHLYSKATHGYFTIGNIQKVRLFSIIAFLTLLTACINFVNLSTAKSEQRAKDVGIQKILGAHRKSLIVQFLAESLILSTFAGCLAFLLLSLAINPFNHLFGYELDIPYHEFSFWLATLLFILFTGLLAGSYPAFLLSGFKPMAILKGSAPTTRQPLSVRKALIVFQFSFTIALLIATLVIVKQIHHAENREQGYDKSNLVYLPLNTKLKMQYEQIKHDLIQSGTVLSMTRSSGTITRQTFGALNFSWPGSNAADAQQAFVTITTDTDFKSTMGTQLVLGRDIDIERYPTDENAVLVNEAAVEAMKLDDPIGTIIRNGEQQWHVVGVVKDFIFYSPYTAISPLFIMGSGDWFNFAYLKLDASRPLQQNLARVSSAIQKYAPNETFEYHFVDEAYAVNFKREKQTANLTQVFSGLAVSISCLGLFGMMAFVVHQRRKEIGIRKVLGASVSGIVSMLSGDFVKLVLVAVIVASPIAWWAMNKWLEDFAYRIEIQWWMFAVAGIVAVAIALLTVSWQALRAAQANPVDSLRDE